ncbi:threonine dehydratase [Niveibacterium sp. 24ML]|uniref:threonine dehydratase n=1 Tax=Niveibacterium sp. 24ML TaxID=2985512 RepID=UPI0022717F50|nr:threonine dehydratase [Niveibacterium sp. 24ML]MCX9157200.1 threonine dehydratase [Niveibacterium sp. 24ML]
MQPDRIEIEQAAERIGMHLRPTPLYQWPLLCQHLAAEVWLKHENHAPTGSFKVRGGLNYFAALKQQLTGHDVICATRGNHGQSIAIAGALHGFRVHVVVPHGNSREKNAAMRALGARVIEAGDDFQAARDLASELALAHNWHLVPAFHPLLVAGVASYAREMLLTRPNLQTVYVPAGMGSGLCGMVAARDALGLTTEIVGVVSAHAPAYANAFELGRPTEAPATTKLADGLACRKTDPAALQIMLRGVARFVRVTDAEIENAMRLIFAATHNVAEGAGAASLAAAMQEGARNRGREIGVVLTGGNIDSSAFAAVLTHSKALPEAA